ncbi:hypothetical protein [Pseudomonas sp. BP01]|uniref:hypothetical protein n=1 Tax=Pseudomonas sp. BP01 TaxID=2976152 RepID=UPI001FAA7308|nr:hypothetical protein [Pseudomonas sp. BP01]
MKQRAVFFKEIIEAGTAAGFSPKNEHSSTADTQRELFIETCKKHDYYNIENISFVNGRWHAIALKNNACFHIDFEVKSRSLVQGRQITAN